MVQRIILLIGLFVLGLVLFITGITTGDLFFILFGIVVALLSIGVGVMLLKDIRQSLSKGNKYARELKVIYRFISPKAFETYHFCAGSVGAVRAVASEVKKSEEKHRQKPIKCTVRSFYTKEKVLKLVKKFYFDFQSPEKLREYFFATMDKFPCDSKTTQTIGTVLDANVKEVTEQFDAMFEDMWKILMARAERTDKENMEILKNHKPTETTGLGFGVITNSVTNLGIYAAMDADERKWQEISNAPKLKSSEEEDSKTLSDTYEKFVKLYHDFMVNTAALFSHDKLYLHSER